MQVLAVGTETARFSPSRRGDRARLRRYERAMTQIDLTVRDTRVLVCHAARLTRHELTAPTELPEVVRGLAAAVFALAAEYEDPERPTDLHRLALDAAQRAAGIHEREPALMVTQVVGQVRSLAVDLVRAAEALGEPAAPASDRPTEELLAAA